MLLMNVLSRAALKTIATDFLEGRLLPLEAALALAPHENEVPQHLRACMTDMVAVASETDDIPLGERREFWRPDVRAREDQKHDKAQAWAEPIVRKTCKRLVHEL
jgi:hypothetical protein